MTTAVIPTRGTTAGKGNKVAGRQQVRLTAVPKPNQDEFRKKLEEENEHISQLQAQVTEITEKIGMTQSGRQDFMKKKDDLHRRLDESKKRIDEIDTKRREMLGQMSSQKEQGRARKTQIQTAKNSSKYNTEEEIDDELRKLEKQIIEGVSSLKEEKDLVTQVQALTKLKPRVRKANKEQPTIVNNSTELIVSLRENLDALATEMKQLQEKKKADQVKLQQLQDERDRSTAPVKDLYDKRTELQKHLTQHKLKVTDAKAAHSIALTEYAEYLQKLRDARRAAEKQEERRSDIEQRRGRIERDLELLSGEANHDPGMQLLHQTVAYTQKLVDDYKGVNDGGEEDKPSTLSPPSGSTTEFDGEAAVLLVPKSQRDDGSSAALSKKKNRKQRKPNSQRFGAISHDIITLADFGRLGVPAPLTYPDAEVCLNRLKEKLQEKEDLHSANEDGIVKQRKALEKELELLDKQENEDVKSQTRAVEEQQQNATVNAAEQPNEVAG